MNATLRFALLSTALVSSAFAQAYRSPYVETTSLTFVWSNNITNISSVSAGGATLPPGTELDPDKIDGIEPIITDTGRVSRYAPPSIPPGAQATDQQFFIQTLLQSLVRPRYTSFDPGVYEGSNTTPPTFTIDRAATIEKLDLGYRWQLVAVREAPRNVAELATNPYTIYLTLIDRTVSKLPNRPLPLDSYFLAGETSPDLSPIVVQTGITLTLGKFAPSGANGADGYKETYTNGRVTAASGVVKTSYTLNYGALYYNDPVHAAGANAKINAYHLKRSVWNLFASGHITYNIRTIAKNNVSGFPAEYMAPSAFVATNISMTGTGWFRHNYDEFNSKGELVSFLRRGGLAPLRLKMGNVQYQNRNLFPDFNP